MDITPLISEEKKVIKGYGAGIFKINSDEVFTQSICVLPDSVHHWQAQQPQDITLESLQIIINHKDDVELLLIGCGETHQPLPPPLHRQLKEHGIATEMMTTGAACRTYNVLLGEGRKVAAALLVV